MESLTLTTLNILNPNKQIKADLTQLQIRLKQLNAWPDAGDEFLDLMPPSRWHPLPVTEADYEWLPKVVNASLEGHDIGCHYPAFFQKLLTNPNLRKMFLDELELQLETGYF